MTTPSLTNPNPKREDERVEAVKKACATICRAAMADADGRPCIDCPDEWDDSSIKHAHWLADAVASARPSLGDPVRAALEGNAFTGWSTSDLAGQCRMQARENLDPELTAFMFAVADRLAALSVSTPTGEGEVREVLYFASYCGDDNPACSDRRPCAECLSMSNVFRAKIEGAVYARELGEPTLAHPQQGGERDGPPTPRTVSQETFERVYFALEELIECAGLRGDNELPHPADDPKLWTSRMQEAWSEAQATLDETSEMAVEAAPTSPSKSSGEEA